MPLIIAHGVPKSGSTFLFQVAKDVAEAINGVSHYEAKKIFFPGMEAPDFVAEPTEAFIDSLVERLPRGAAHVVKTHGELTPGVAAHLRRRDIKVIISFRDPRDTAISMLDTGVRDRSKGNSRFFTTLNEVGDTLGPARHGWRVARKWLDCPNILPVPYYLTATNQRRVISLVCAYLGAPRSFYSIAPKYEGANRQRITEFHKGVADRFLDDLTPAEISQLSEKLAVEIAEVDALTLRWMNAYGYRLLVQALRNKRLARLDALPRSEPANYRDIDPSDRRDQSHVL